MHGNFSFQRKTKDFSLHFSEKKLINMASKLIEKLTEKIEKELGIQCDQNTFRRTYAGYWQRRLGAFVWVMGTIDGYQVGSIERVSDLVNNSVRLVYDQKEGEIFGEQKK